MYREKIYLFNKIKLSREADFGVWCISLQLEMGIFSNFIGDTRFLIQFNTLHKTWILIFIQYLLMQQLSKNTL